MLINTIDQRFRSCFPCISPPYFYISGVLRRVDNSEPMRILLMRNCSTYHNLSFHRSNTNVESKALIIQMQENLSNILVAREFDTLLDVNVSSGWKSSESRIDALL